MYRVLLLEDDPEICEIIQFYLLRNGNYEVNAVHSCAAALQLLQLRSFDILLLDIMLPEQDGISFCAQIRKTIYCPILFISCLNDDQTIIRALNMGGDDYIVKPFQEGILLARIEANLRRSQFQHPEGEKNLSVGALCLDTKTHTLIKDAASISLSPTEYAILRYLMQNPGKPLRFESIYKAIWDRPSLGDLRTLFVHIRHLRQKIEEDPACPVYIKTHQRDSYIFCGSAN